MSSIRSSTVPVDVRQLGTVDYRVAWQLQRELANARVAGNDFGFARMNRRGTDLDYWDGEP